MRGKSGVGMKRRNEGFFFQAEDGIRDHCMTGVQTCALPIGQRSGDVVDWLADGIGVLIGQGLGMLLARAVASCRKGRKEGASCGNERRP